MTRRKFFKTAGGMAAAFAAMNEVHAKGSQPFYEVEQATKPRTSRWRRRAPTG